MRERHSKMTGKRTSAEAKSRKVFGQAQRSARMLRAGLYARVSTNDQQILPTKSARCLSMHPGAVGLSPGRFVSINPEREGGQETGRRAGLVESLRDGETDFCLLRTSIDRNCHTRAYLGDCLRSLAVLAYPEWKTAC